ncbi:hypothetical protein PYW08_009662 [Mythimna loreyi]|uniref:Uncharacterized protein n=1 Tax=Mythimna loreyi TaxID=667449 RepID=A0ACC2Q6P4_9NEOP|nr:hypothetical protein PYW08_009662 [Mythimna loreyi]
MLKSISYAISARKLFATGPLISRLQPRQPCTPGLFNLNRQPADYQIATITRSPVNFKYQDPKERDPCPVPPPPPPPPPKDDRALWGTIALFFLTGGFVVYAKGSPEIRDWLSINASWFDDIIAVLYQENMTYGEFAASCIKQGKDYLTGQNKPKKCSTDGKVVEDAPKPPKLQSKDEDAEKPCEKEPPPVFTANICDIEKCMNELSECAVNNYYTAWSICTYYNKLVQDTMQTFTIKGMKELRPAMEERNELIKESLKQAADCIHKIDEMVRYLDCGVKGTKEQIRNSKLLYEDLAYKYKSDYDRFWHEHQRSLEMDRQWQMVEELIDKYTMETESMFPGLQYSSKNPKLTGDIDIIFTNSLRYIQYLNERLKEASDGMTERVNRAMADLPREGAKNREMILANILKDKKAELEKNYKDRTDEQKARNEKNLKDSIKKLKDNHEENMDLKLKQMEEQVQSQFDKMVSDKVKAEKKVFAAELEEMSVKLRVVEAKLEARLKAERETRRSQELWAAGASLLAATKKGEPFVKVDKELKAIEKASGNEDQLVLTVLKSIPKSVREKGIVPESVLRDDFHVMEKTARSVALIEQDGAPLPVYMLSYLQGMLLFMTLTGIPQREFEKPPLVPPTDLDTFDLLQRASFWVERGNLAIAVRYVDSLKGASRAAAAKWFEAARAHLEVRQAAEAILAHAASLGLRYI